MNPLFELTIFRNAVTKEITIHADCVCHEEGINGTGASLFEAEKNFHDDGERHEMP